MDFSQCQYNEHQYKCIHSRVLFPLPVSPVMTRTRASCNWSRICLRTWNTGSCLCLDIAYFTNAYRADLGAGMRPSFNHWTDWGHEVGDAIGSILVAAIKFFYPGVTELWYRHLLLTIGSFWHFNDLLKMSNSFFDISCARVFDIRGDYERISSQNKLLSNANGKTNRGNASHGREGDNFTWRNYDNQLSRPSTVGEKSRCTSEYTTGCSTCGIVASILRNST